MVGDDGDEHEPYYTEEEHVTLTLLIVAINGWNRIQIGLRAAQPAGERAAA